MAYLTETYGEMAESFYPIVKTLMDGEITEEQYQEMMAEYADDAPHLTTPEMNMIFKFLNVMRACNEVQTKSDQERAVGSFGSLFN